MIAAGRSARVRSRNFCRNWQREWPGSNCSKPISVGPLEQAKLEALKEFAYGAGHEINNPLANISARAQTLLKDEADPQRRQKLAAINTQAFRAHEMIADLMLFARPPAMHAERIELAPFLTELARTWQAQAAEQQTEIELNVADGPNPGAGSLAVWADRTRLGGRTPRAWWSMPWRPWGAAGEWSLRRVRLACGPPAPPRLPGPEKGVEIRVSDNGPGIPADIRA